MKPDRSSKKQRELVFDKIAKWITASLDEPDRRARAGEAIKRTLLRHLSIHWDEEIPDAPPLVPKDHLKYKLCMDFMSLLNIEQSLKECEYYFRRYPFSSLPISKADHLRNVCEMYFDRIYQFRERLKNTTKTLQKMQGNGRKDYGPLISAFDAAFDFHIRSRHKVHHHGRFEHDVIDQLSIGKLLSLDDTFAPFYNEDSIYRVETRKWVDSVRKCAVELDKVIEHLSPELVPHL